MPSKRRQQSLENDALSSRREDVIGVISLSFVGPKVVGP